MGGLIVVRVAAYLIVGAGCGGSCAVLTAVLIRTSLISTAAIAVAVAISFVSASFGFVKATAKAHMLFLLAIPITIIIISRPRRIPAVTAVPTIVIVVW